MVLRVQGVRNVISKFIRKYNLEIASHVEEPINITRKNLPAVKQIELYDKIAGI